MNFVAGGGEADDAQWQGALCRTAAPSHQGVLRVRVHDEDLMTQLMKRCSQVHRDGGFSAPTFLVTDRNDFGCHG
jgi:hypothetical protein